MHLKIAIKKIAVPILGEQGFELVECERSYFEFKNTNRTRSISIDIDPYFKRSLRVTYAISENLRTFFGDDDFAPEFGLPGAEQYSNQAELELLLTQIMSATVLNVLPYMDRLVEYYIKPTIAMYESLAKGPEVQAAEFAKNHGLSLEETKDNLIQTELVLMALRDAPIENRYGNFFKNIDEIIAAAAYLGEIHRLGRGGSEWKWIDHSFIVNDIRYESVYFAIGYKNGGKYDSLEKLQKFWNYYPELYMYRLYPLYL